MCISSNRSQDRDITKELSAGVQHVGRVLHLVETVAAGDSTVLLLGETGAHGAADSETQRLINPSRRPFFASVRAPVSLSQVLASERKALALRYEEWHALGANLLLKRKFKRLLDSLGIRVPKGNGFHAIRHANAMTTMDRLGAPLKVRQERLGHSDPHVTQAIYTTSQSEDSQRVAAQFGRGSLGNFGREGTQKGKRLRSRAS